MRESETFDAFYARTVASVTSKIHALAGGDAQADHAIREAYARAYQQWYEVSGFRDTEAWVLDVAREAFERRRGQSAPLEPQSAEQGSWPGFFRQQPEPSLQPGPVDPVAAGASPGQAAAAPAGTDLAGYPGHDDEATVSPRGVGLASEGQAGASAFPAAAAGSAQFPARRRQPGATAQVPGLAGDTTAGSPMRNRPLPPRNRALIGAIAAVVVVAGSIGAYVALSGPKQTGITNPSSSSSAGAKPAARMLPAGKVGSSAAVPWSLVGPGWALAEVSSAPAGSAGSVAAASETYLVDPEGGRYLMRSWSGEAPPRLLAWSGDAASALFGSSTAAAGSGTASYFVLKLKSGQVTQLSLPANVAVTGFTRPNGLNLLAVQQGPTHYKLVRYDLQGVFQAMVATMARTPSAPAWLSGCGGGCGALSSPDGTLAVWGAPGDQMELASNSGGVIRKLHVTQNGQPQSCAPISWWDSSTVLANCTAANGQSTAAALFLVPESGAGAQSLTTASGAPDGTGYNTGAWLAAGQEYITQTTAMQCPAAPSGPGGMEILGLASSGSNAPVAIPGSSGKHDEIVGANAGRLLVLTQTSCPGTSSLLSYDPAKNTARTMLAGSPGQVGVTAAVPYGSGTAVAGN